MVKIVLVDDEYYTRLAISKSTPWEDLGYVLVGEADNGQDGLALITDLEPDVAIIDINMPIMDGLTLVKKVKELGLATRCVMLTGYSEFTYAREALRLHVSNYLLKPVNQDELEEELVKLHEEVLSAKSQGKKKFIENLINKGFTIDHKESFNPFKESQEFHLVTLYHHIAPEAEYLYEDIRERLYKVVEEKYGSQGMTCWISDGGLLHVLIERDEKRATFDASFLADYKRAWEKDQEKMIICHSEGFKDLTYLKKIYEAHVRVMANKLFLESEEVLAVQENSFNKDSSYKGLADKEKKTFIRLLRERDEEKLQKFLHEQVHEIKNKGYSTKVMEYFIQELLTKAYEHIEECQQEEGIEPYPHEEWPVLLNNAISLGEVEEKLMSYLVICLNKLRDMEVSESDLLVDKIKEYVIEHYQEQDCNIQKVVHHFSFSYHYLCKLFKSKTGDTLGDYIITTRMDMAKVKILQGQRNIEILAGDCGYTDSRYFSKCFKKYYGITPSRYVKQTKVV